MTLDLATFPFRTIVFDLDGTLIDSARDVGEAVNRVLAEQGLAPLDEATMRSQAFRFARRYARRCRAVAAGARFRPPLRRAASSAYARL